MFNFRIYIYSKKTTISSYFKKNDYYMDQLKMSGYYGMHVCPGLWRNKKL